MNKKKQIKMAWRLFNIEFSIRHLGDAARRVSKVGIPLKKALENLKKREI